MQALQCECLCKQIAIEIKQPPFIALNCHCSICRRWIGANYNSICLFADKSVQIVRGKDQLSSYNTSPAVKRLRCNKCGEPVVEYMTNEKGRITEIVPLAMMAPFFGDKRIPEKFKPTMHIYYNDRVVDVEDNLPKYLGSVQQGPAKQPIPKL